MSVKCQHLKILACQNSIQHVVKSMDLLDVNVILDMRVILLMENVESYRHQWQWKNKIQTNAPKIQSVKVIEIIRRMLFTPDLAVKEMSHILLFIPDFYKVEVAFYSVFDHRIEKNQFESKFGIKSNFDLIEIRNKKQNTHVRPEKHLKITLFEIRNKKRVSTRETPPRQSNPE